MGVPRVMAECHLEMVTEQITKTLKAFSFILAYAKKRLTLLSASPSPSPTTLKKIHTPISNLAIYLAHNHRKRAELLTSLVAYPDPESTLKRMYSTGFPSLPVHCRRQIQ